MTRGFQPFAAPCCPYAATRWFHRSDVTIVMSPSPLHSNRPAIRIAPLAPSRSIRSSTCRNIANQIKQIPLQIRFYSSSLSQQWRNQEVSSFFHLVLGAAFLNQTTKQTKKKIWKKKKKKRKEKQHRKTNICIHIYIYIYIRKRKDS